MTIPVPIRLLLTAALFATGASAASGASDLATIDCAAATPAEAEVEVAPKRGGVHIRFVNPTTTTFGFTAGPGYLADGDIRPGERTVIADLAPGRHEVACFDRNDPAQDPPNAPGYRRRIVTLVVTASPLFTPRDLQCDARGIRALNAWNTAVERFVPGDMAALTLANMRGLQRGDVVVRAGYQSGPNIHMRVVRGERIVAGSEFLYDAASGTVHRGSALQCLDTLPARMLLTKLTSPLGVAYTHLDGDAFVITRTPAMSRTMRAALNRPFAVRCDVGGRRRAGSGRFRAGLGQAVVRLADVADTEAVKGRCDIVNGRGVILTFRRFASIRVY